MYQLNFYNYYVNNGDRTIYFNSISGQIFSVSEQENQFLQNQFNDLISFELEYNSMFKKFVDWEFITDTERDQKDVIRLINHKKVFLDKTYRLVLNPTLECNFRCWYCYEDHVTGKMSEEIMEKIKKHVKLMIKEERISGLFLDWFGGEPLLYFDEIIVPLSEQLRDIMTENGLSFFTQATTNGSLITEERAKKMNELGMKHFQITLDGDEKRHNRIRNMNGAPSYKQILQGIYCLCENIPDVNITLRINYDTQTLEKSNMKEVFEMIPIKYRYKINPSFHRVWQTESKRNEEGNNLNKLAIFDYCKELGYDVESPTSYLSVLKGHTCYVDRYYHTEINFDGKIYKCTARAYSDEYVLGELQDDGHIFWKQEKMRKMYAKATFENEMCLACKHMPLCTGPCSQKLLETPKELLHTICPLTTADVNVDTFIRNLYDKKMKSLQATESLS